MKYHEIIAYRIQTLCNQRSLSINRLASMSGLNQSTIDNIMHGASQNPRLMTVHKIANAFSMTLAEFLDFPELNEVSFEEDLEDDGCHLL